MLTPDKKPTASPPPLPTPATAPIPLASSKAGPLAAAVAAAQAATPITEPKKRLWLSRETKLGLVVACSFIAVTAGVMTVKRFWPSSEPEKTAPEVAAARQVEIPEIPPTQPQPVRITSNIIEAAPVVPDVHLMPPPPVIKPVRAEVPSVSLELPPPIESPVIESVTTTPMKPLRTEGPPEILPPLEVPEVPTRPKKDDFTSKPVKEVKIEALDLPPPVAFDSAKPVIKNPVLLAGNKEPKNEDPPKLDAPPLIADPPIVEVPMKKEVEPIRIDPPVIDAPMKKEAAPPMIEAPLIIDVPVKKEAATPKLESPPAIEVPMKKEPARIDQPAIEPTRIDLPTETPMIEKPKKADAPPLRKDGDFDEDLHSAKPNETYRAISKQYYNSEAYAVALQRYNRDNPGQADYVRIPPIWVLEKKYQADISANPTRTVNFNAPPVADSNTKTEPVYTVGDNGEMLADVAKKQLGNEEAWKRLWELNPQVNPAKVIPGGTRLRLP